MFDMISWADAPTIALVSAIIFLALAAIRLFVRMLAADVYREKRRSQLILMQQLKGDGPNGQCSE